MGLNIKNVDAEKAIRELAELTGEGLTEAVTKAAREKIARIREQKEKQTLKGYLAAIRPIQDAIAKERAARGDTRASQELMDELYDDHGLPV